MTHQFQAHKFLTIEYDNARHNKNMEKIHSTRLKN
jgi:hypothetical protein